MDYSNESLTRIKKINDLKKAWVIVYANNFREKQDIDEIKIQNDKNIKEVDILMENWANWDFKTAWRLISYRGHWKLSFWKIMDHKDIIQICFVKDKFIFNTWKDLVESIEVDWQEKTPFKLIEKYVDVWDYIGIIWDLFYTKHWELTLFVKELQILSKAIRPLPEKFHWVSDKETIYRQRYLDLIMNEQTYKRFLFRSDFVKAIRDFYNINGFTEIETPVLWNSASWAAAKPFITHHNDYDEDFYLRIAPETSLKKSTVWRFERVFELSRNFRNEWSDPSHVQEYSEFEHYAAYRNFEDNINFTERLFDYIFDTLKLDRKINIKDKDWNIRQVDFETPWKRIDYIEWVKEKSWIDIKKYKAQDEEKLRQDIINAWYTWEWIDKQATATMIDYLYKKVLRPWIVWPAFVYNYPKTMQPLARQSDSDENIVEQFQLVLNGWEVLKAYSELVDPKLQQENFDEQSWAIEKWDEEATSSDDDFVLSMEYWMPCQSWRWMWVERIVALLTEQDNLRDVQLFPLMKSENKELDTWKTKNAKMAVVILNKSLCSEKWQELNTVAHLNSAFGARLWKGLFLKDKVSTKDWYDINLNIQHAIIIKETDSNKILKEVLELAKKDNIEFSEFTREMLETSDDKKVEEKTSKKDYKDIEYMWVLVFGDKKDVEKITKEFSLYK